MSCRAHQLEETIHLFREAAAANRQTSARKGNVIMVSAHEADEVMVTADLHGHIGNFQSLLEIAALDDHPRRHLVMQEVCHGGPPYPDGGCQSHTLLEEMARLKLTYPDRFHFILSNHELAELTDFPILKGQRILNVAFRCGLLHAFGPEYERVREAALEFIRSCPLAVRLPNDIFISHSLPGAMDRQHFDRTIFDRPLEEDDFREYGSLFNLVWGRDYRPANAEAFAQAVGAKILIHGHDPCPQGYKAPNDLQIILDCCSTPATYLLVPTGEGLSHGHLVRQIRFLPPKVRSH